jgi:hypothetical protein
MFSFVRVDKVKTMLSIVNRGVAWRGVAQKMHIGDLYLTYSIAGMWPVGNALWCNCAFAQSPSCEEH